MPIWKIVFDWNIYYRFKTKLYKHNYFVPEKIASIFKTFICLDITGNHWLNAIIPRLLRNSVDSDHRQSDQMLEYVEDLESLKSMPSPRVMTSHLPSRNLPKDHIAKGGKIVHIIRNPKDVALSAFHHYNQDPHVTEVHGVSKDLSTFLDSFLKGGTVTYCKA